MVGNGVTRACRSTVGIHRSDGRITRSPPLVLSRSAQRRERSDHAATRRRADDCAIVLAPAPRTRSATLASASTMTRRSPAASPGFTLIELLVVLAVLALLATVALPALGARAAAWRAQDRA